jgi:hypothetical protein
MTHFWAFFFTTVFAMLREVRAKNFYHSFIYFSLFVVGIIGMVISLMAYLVSMFINSLKN